MFYHVEREALEFSCTLTFVQASSIIWFISMAEVSKKTKTISRTNSITPLTDRNKNVDVVDKVEEIEFQECDDEGYDDDNENITDPRVRFKV